MSPLSSLPLFFFLIITVLIQTTSAQQNQQKCYDLTGRELDSSFQPCKPNARHSGCCILRPRTQGGPIYMCLDNGLCMATANEFMGTVFQAGCTDPTGRDPSCPKLCPNDLNSPTQPKAYNIQMCDYGSYCCRDARDRRNCCNNSTSPKLSTSSLGALLQTSTTSSSTSTSSTPTSTTTSQEPTSVFGTAVSTGNPEPLSHQTSTPIPPSDPPASSQSNTRAAVIGGAVGGVLGAIILGLVGIIVWMWKKERRQRKLKEHYEEQFGQNFAYRRTIVVESDAQLVGDGDAGSLRGETLMGSRGGDGGVEKGETLMGSRGGDGGVEKGKDDGEGTGRAV